MVNKHLFIALLLTISIGNAWLTGYDYRKELNITETNGTAMTNFQVFLNLTYSTNMSSTYFDEIRITNSTDGLLDYWFQDINNGTNAELWFEIDNLAVNASETFYVYYGNSTNTNQSNITNTMLFGDDFEDGILDWTTRWESTDHSEYSESGGNLNIAHPSASTKLINSQYNATDFRATIKIQHGDTDSLYTTLTTAKATWQFNDAYDLKPGTSIRALVNAVSDTYGTATQNVWYIENYTWPTAGNVENRIYRENNLTQMANKTGTPTSRWGYISFMKWNTENANTGKVDYILIRKYALNEPSIVIGSETSVPTNDTIAPSLNILSPVNNTQTGNTTITFTFNSSDETENTTNCNLYVNSSIWKTNASVENATNTIFTVTNFTAGNWTWYMTCSDGTNTNTSGTYNLYIYNFSIDYDTPTPATDTWTNANYTVNVTNTGIDPIDTCILHIGTSNYTMTNAGDAMSAYNTTTSVSEGTYTYNVTCNSTIGLTSNTTNRTIKIDLTAPTTTTGYTGTLGENGWYTTNVQVTLTCNDGTGIGCNTTRYNLAGAGWTTYSSTFTVSTEANNTLQFFSNDSLNNIESTNTEYVPVDKTAPTATITSSTTGVNVTITCTCTDATSGCIENMTVYYDGTPYSTPHNTPITIETTVGSHHSFYCVIGDLSGQNTTSDILTIATDNTPPTITVITVVNKHVKVLATDNIDAYVTCTLTSPTSKTEPCGELPSGTATWINAKEVGLYTITATDDYGNTGTDTFTTTASASDTQNSLDNLYEPNTFLNYVILLLLSVGGIGLFIRFKSRS